MGENMLSINEAAGRGIDKLRKPVWAHPEAYVKIDIIDGQAGPWLHLHVPGEPAKDLLGVMQGSYDEECFVPLDAALTDTDAAPR